jgi:hypothetical protein
MGRLDRLRTFVLKNWTAAFDACDAISAIRGSARKCHTPAASDVPADAGLGAKSGGSWQMGETQMAFRVRTAVRGLATGASTAQMTRGLSR